MEVRVCRIDRGDAFHGLQSSDESEKSSSEWDDWDNETEDVTILLQDLSVFFRC